jgi:RNA polymerase sigma-70 factor (ECF subfamily)
MVQKKNADGSSLRINSQGGFLRTQEMGMSQQLSDEILVTQVAEGNSNALESLYDRHAATVLGILLKIIGDRPLAEDVLQETFWRVWQSASTYKAERGSFTGWLFRIARNLAIDAYRRRNVRPQVLNAVDESKSMLDEIPDPDVEVLEQVQSNIQNQQIRISLASLPRVQRQVIELAYFYGMTRQEIAEATGEALGTIHTRARLALQKLREELEKAKLEG